MKLRVNTTSNVQPHGDDDNGEAAKIGIFKRY